MPATGSVTAVVVAITVTKSLGGSDALALSMAPKSTTTPVASRCRSRSAGSVRSTAAFTIITGILGAVAAPRLLTALRVRDQRVRGSGDRYVLARHRHLACAAGQPHRRGFSGLAMALNALVTAVLLPAAAGRTCPGCCRVDAAAQLTVHGRLPLPCRLLDSRPLPCRRGCQSGAAGEGRAPVAAGAGPAGRARTSRAGARRAPAGPAASNGARSARWPPRAGWCWRRWPPGWRGPTARLIRRRSRARTSGIGSLPGQPPQPARRARRVRRT